MTQGEEAGMRGSGMSFMDKLANVLGNVATRINNLRYIMVIKNAFAALIPVIITGAFGSCFQQWSLIRKMG